MRARSCAVAEIWPFKITQDGGGRHLGFVRTVNSAVRSAVPEKTKTMKSINLLKILAHTRWGANHSSLLTIYRSVVHFKLDYGSIVYGSARKSYLSKLEPVANAALRLSLGAFRTSPIPSYKLYLENLHLVSDVISVHYNFIIN